jgi:hypothetical protein
MFCVHCPRHGTLVLLGPDQIVSLVNTAYGIELHWVCWCGERGVERFGRVERRDEAAS